MNGLRLCFRGTDYINILKWKTYFSSCSFPNCPKLSINQSTLFNHESYNSNYAGLHVSRAINTIYTIRLIRKLAKIC